jgi:hypothetical protein
VKLIKSDALKTVLLVASEEADRFYAENGIGKVTDKESVAL